MINLNACNFCPKNCGINRTETIGFCGAPCSARVAKACLHFWEEPCISGKNGSGTVFFSHCNLKCCYCQNYQISAQGFGKNISAKQLAIIFENLQAKGAHNINLVSATVYLPFVVEALQMAKLHVPVVYNTSGYETVETLNALAPYVNIWLADLKYVSPQLSQKYSLCDNYFEYASKAILHMQSLAPKPVFNKDGIMQQGLILRHLALPNATADSKAVLTWIKENLDEKSFLMSIMSQYTPFYKAHEHKELSRRISTYEYNKIIDIAVTLNLVNGYMQERSSAKEEYTPKFDLEGVEN